MGAIEQRALALADAARAASRLVAAASAEQRTRAIEALASRIDDAEFRARLLAANAEDVAAARSGGRAHPGSIGWRSMGSGSMRSRGRCAKWRRRAIRWAR